MSERLLVVKQLRFYPNVFEAACKSNARDRKTAKAKNPDDTQARQFIEEVAAISDYRAWRNLYGEEVVKVEDMLSLIGSMGKELELDKEKDDPRVHTPAERKP